MKKKLILFQVFIAIVLICTSVYAAIDATLELTASSTTLNPGDTVTVKFSIKDINITGTSSGVEYIDGYINYDNNVFEDITVDNIVKNSNGTLTIGSDTLTMGSDVIFNNSVSGNDAKISIDLNTPITTNTTILTIKFVVKESATIGTISNVISFDNLDVTASLESVSVESSVSIDLTIAETSSDTNNTNTNTNNTNTNSNNNTNTNNTNNTNNNTNSNSNTNNTNTNSNNNTNTNNTNSNTNSNSNTNTDNTVATSILPATGIKAAILPAIILIILAYISYNKYMKYKKV